MSICRHLFIYVFTSFFGHTHLHNAFINLKCISFVRLAHTHTILVRNADIYLVIVGGCFEPIDTHTHSHTQIDNNTRSISIWMHKRMQKRENADELEEKLILNTFYVIYEYVWR